MKMFIFGCKILFKKKFKIVVKVEQKEGVYCFFEEKCKIIV